MIINDKVKWSSDKPFLFVKLVIDLRLRARKEWPKGDVSRDDGEE